MLIRCPACEKEYSYGRGIFHSCGSNSIPFGKIFENEQKAYNWNCNTVMMSQVLMEKNIKPTESLIEKIPEASNFKIKTKNQQEWNCNAACYKI